MVIGFVYGRCAIHNDSLEKLSEGCKIRSDSVEKIIGSAVSLKL